MAQEILNLNRQQWLERVANQPRPSKYHAMYSTWWQGIVTDPELMMIPIDDHQVHRGDAVFEAFRVINGKLYLLKEHLDRLDKSCAALSLNSPLSRAELIHVIEECVKASSLKNALIRLFLGRGPGSFTANPYDTVGEQLHVVVTDFIPPSEKKINQGVRLMTSKIGIKDSFWAQIKSCNYLVNVLMKKEAVDHKMDFTVGVDKTGHFTEGSTENLVVLTKDGTLTHPHFNQILSGCTMKRCLQLTSLPSCERAVGKEDLLNAHEVMMIGTTLDVLSVIEFDGQKIGQGTPGPVAKELKELLIKDQS